MIEVIDSELRHVRELSKVLRDKDRQEAEKLGFKANRLLYQSFRYGIYRKTAFVNGKIAAMWGVAGTPFGVTGQPYLITSNAVKEISPIKFARIYKREVEQMKKLFPILENYVDASYREAVRMLEIAGFELGPVELLGPDNSEYRKFKA